jgi:hypothetical protein
VCINPFAIGELLEQRAVEATRCSVISPSGSRETVAAELRIETPEPSFTFLALESPDRPDHDRTLVAHSKPLLIHCIELRCRWARL